jgi:hypothetical protein
VFKTISSGHASHQNLKLNRVWRALGQWALGFHEYKMLYAPSMAAILHYSTTAEYCRFAIVNKIALKRRSRMEASFCKKRKIIKRHGHASHSAPSFSLIFLQIN